MKFLSFSVYYVRLIFDVLTGRHTTNNPLSIRYRWRNWDYISIKRRDRRRKGFDQ